LSKNGILKPYTFFSEKKAKEYGAYLDLKSIGDTWKEELESVETFSGTYAEYAHNLTHGCLYDANRILQYAGVRANNCYFVDVERVKGKIIWYFKNLYTQEESLGEFQHLSLDTILIMKDCS